MLLSSVLNIWDQYAESVSNLELEARKVAGVFATLAQLHTLLGEFTNDNILKYHI